MTNFLIAVLLKDWFAKDFDFFVSVSVLKDFFANREKKGFEITDQA